MSGILNIIRYNELCDDKIINNIEDKNKIKFFKCPTEKPEFKLVVTKQGDHQTRNK